MLPRFGFPANPVIQLYRNLTEVSRADGGPGTTESNCFQWLLRLVPRPVRRPQREVAVLICQGVMREAALAYCSMRRAGRRPRGGGLSDPAFRLSRRPAIRSMPTSTRAAHHWTAWQKQHRGRDRMAARPAARGASCCAAWAAAPRSRPWSQPRGGTRHRRPAAVRAGDRRPQLHPAADPRSRPAARPVDAARARPRDPRERISARATVAQMARSTCARSSCRAGMKVAIFARPENKAVDDCVQAWVARGVEASRHGFDGLLRAAAARHRSTRRTSPTSRTPIAWLKQRGPPAIRHSRHAGQPAGGRCCSRRAASTRR